MNGVFLATCIASAIGTICMAFFANKPFVMAPGMGLNSFFAVVVANIAVINECEYESAFPGGARHHPCRGYRVPSSSRS